MYEFTIPALNGRPDKHAIVSAVQALDSDAELDFNLVTHKVNVKSRADLAEIRDMLAAIGYQIEKIAQHDP